jgi:GntR family transcriptional regulator of gluconate operon
VADHATGSPTTANRPVRRQVAAPSRRQQVVDLLREDIIEGKLPPGSQLKQDLLAEEFGSSGGPIREALRQLESEGLVQHIPNRGVFVMEIIAEDLLGVLLPVRLAIESYAAVRLARQGDDATFDELEEIVKAMEAVATRGDLAEVNDLDLAFHQLTVRASGSAHAVQLWHSVQPRIRAQIYRLSPRHRAIGEIPREHRELLAALRGGRERTVRKVVEEHIIGSAAALLGASDERRNTRDGKA